MLDLEYENYIAKLRDKMEEVLAQYPFKERRKELKWKQVLDKDKKILDRPIYHIISEMETEHLHNILKDVDYDNATNYDIILRTIWEEYHYRKRNKIN